MWEYNYTGLDASDSLQHFKYIRKYQTRNGKWRYVYADSKTHSNIFARGVVYANKKSLFNTYKDRLKDSIARTKDLSAEEKKQFAPYINADQQKVLERAKEWNESGRAYDDLIMQNSVKKQIAKGQDFVKKLFNSKKSSVSHQFSFSPNAK